MRTSLFALESPRSTALMRIALGGLLLVDALWRFPYTLELYADTGAPLSAFGGTIFDPLVPGPHLAIGLQSVGIFLAATTMLGWGTRVSLVLLTLIQFWFSLLDLPSTLAKYSVLATHLGVLLVLSGCGRVWSVDRWLTGDSGGLACPLAPAWPRRLLQILVCAVYLGSAVTKIRSPDFASGDLLLFSLLDDHWGGTTWGQTLAVHPRLLVFASFVTLFFELLFPILVWVPRCRRVLVLLAVGFHLTLWLVMHLGVFPPMMLLALLAFLDERDLSWLLNRIERAAHPLAKLRESDSGMTPESIPARRPRWRQAGLSAAAWLVLALLTAGTGYWIQYQQDWYGLFGRRIPPAPSTVDPSRVATMLAGQRMQEEDYLHQMELGSRVGGVHLFGAGEQFRHGMTVFVNLRLILPHPPLRVEGILLDPTGEEVTRWEQAVEAWQSRLVRGFALDESLPAGRYRILLQANGYEIGQQEFDLVP